MMNNKFLLIFAITIFMFAGCKKNDLVPSTSTPTSIPEVIPIAEASYVFGVGSGQIFATIPDKIAIAVDSVAGFDGGFGGKTGKDTFYILKSNMKGDWPDTTQSGGFPLDFETFNLSGYKAHSVVNIVLAAPIASPDLPGPTDISGTYMRTLNGFLIDIIKVFDGVYVLDNPGGAGVQPNPYLLYNYKNSAGGDSLAFPNQTNPCGGGTKLVGPTAPLGLSSADYSAQYPPAITSLAPVTLQWIVLEFEDTDDGSTGIGALCQFGTSVRTFIKQ